MWLFYIIKYTVGTVFRIMWRSWRPEGIENVPKGKAILVSNHVSSADGSLISCYGYKRVSYLAKAELFSTPMKRFIFKGLGEIPIKRGGSDREAFRFAIEALDRGAHIGIFPEGTRGDGRTLLPAHTGMIRLALLTDAPLVPIGISGSRKAWKKGAKFPSFARVKVRIGVPYHVPKAPDGREYTYDELKMMADDFMREHVAPLIDPSMND